jgi:hypothetical protein
MKPGDTIIDSQGCNWTISQHLGVGLWGRSALARGSDGREVVVKAALRPSDFPVDVALPDRIGDSCARCLLEQKTLLESAKYPFLPKLEGVATLSDGRHALIMTRYRRSPANGAELPVVQLLARILQVGRMLEKHRRTHGNLRPSNILWNERGEPVLTDLMTPSANKLRALVQSFAADRQWNVPPEAHSYPTPVWDTWALCRQLFGSLTANSTQPGGDFPGHGVDKLQLTTLKDQTLARLKREGTNLRFIGRITEKTAAMLNRGLSAQDAPSPPYRFNDISSLCERLNEIYHLTLPQVVSIGKILFTTTALDNVFTGTTLVTFSVSIGCSKGITSHDDIVCGLQLVDRDAQASERVELDDIQYEGSVHASGRLRFRFQIPNVLPGRYSIRVAFSIKGSGNEPILSIGTFEVRPQPGYIPPAETTRIDKTLRFPNETLGPKVRFDVDCTTALFTDPGNPTLTPVEELFEPAGYNSNPSTSPESFYSVPRSVDSGTGGELIEGFFPKPIAPSQGDSLPPTQSIVRTAAATMPPSSSDEEIPHQYEPQRMVATAIVTPPVEQISPQVHASALPEPPVPSAPSRYFRPPRAFSPGMDPIVPSSPMPSRVQHEPSIGQVGTYGQSSMDEQSGMGPREGWFEGKDSSKFLLDTAPQFDAMLPGANGIEDLPTCTETEERPLPVYRVYLNKAIRIAQDDLYVATILAGTACISGILCLTLVMKSCG